MRSAGRIRENILSCRLVHSFLNIQDKSTRLLWLRLQRVFYSLGNPRKLFLALEDNSVFEEVIFVSDVANNDTAKDRVKDAGGALG